MEKHRRFCFDRYYMLSADFAASVSIRTYRLIYVAVKYYDA